MTSSSRRELALCDRKGHQRVARDSRWSLIRPLAVIAETALYRPVTDVLRDHGKESVCHTPRILPREISSFEDPLLIGADSIWRGVDRESRLPLGDNDRVIHFPHLGQFNERIHDPFASGHGLDDLSRLPRATREFVGDQSAGMNVSDQVRNLKRSSKPKSPAVL